VISNITSNVNTALKWGVEFFKDLPDTEIVTSRGGHRTLEAPFPVCTTYLNPTERVLFSPTRDANPFFHFFEGLWMLAGHNDLAFLTKFTKRMAEFSDDGRTLWGAYGWRWRKFFGFDQIEQVTAMLKRDHSTRRAVVSMWSPTGDMARAATGGKDVPCNTNIYFKIKGGALNMTVCNRSNDMLWGAYGANAVHMSMLLEYVAAKVGVPVGVMRQVSDSFHVYLPPHPGGVLWEKMKQAGDADGNPYKLPFISAHPMAASDPGWDDDLTDFMYVAGNDLEEVRPNMFDTAFFKLVVAPLWLGWTNRSTSAVEMCAAADWRTAALEWLRRRAKR
jgi:thymidylate synthase